MKIYFDPSRTLLNPRVKSDTFYIHQAPGWIWYYSGNKWLVSPSVSAKLTSYRYICRSIGYDENMTPNGNDDNYREVSKAELLLRFGHLDYIVKWIKTCTLEK